MGTQVITRDSGRRLGVVGEVVVDIDRREVVALGLRDNPLTRFLPGLPRWMPLDRIRQVGDVILVDSADSLSEGFAADRYGRIINCQVITESGQQLGRVLGFSFDIETGELTTLVMGALGVPLLGEGVLSTWEIPVDEIVSSGADRIIVYGAGYIALEFAGIFNGFGSEVHLVYRGDLPLRGFDDDIRQHMAEALANRGIHIHNGATVTVVRPHNKQLAVKLSDGQVIMSDQILAATGRVPNTQELGLETAGVEMTSTSGPTLRPCASAA